MGKYDEIIQKLKQIGISVRKIGDIRPDSARIIDELLDRLETHPPITKQPEITTLYQETKLTPLQQKIIGILKREEQIRFKQLAQELKIKQNHLWNNLNILLKLGFVNKIKYSRKDVYYTVS